MLRIALVIAGLAMIALPATAVAQVYADSSTTDVTLIADGNRSAVYVDPIDPFHTLGRERVDVLRGGVSIGTSLQMIDWVPGRRCPPCRSVIRRGTTKGTRSSPRSNTTVCRA